MAKPIRPGGFKNFLASTDKDKAAKKKAELQELRKKARETGSYLEKPVTAAVTSAHEAPGPPPLLCGECTVQGWRRANEDASAVVLSLPGHPTVAFVGVYDGHGGDAVSRCCSRTLHRLADERLPADCADSEAVSQALRQSFVAMDTACREQLREEEISTTGATCNVVILTPSAFVCGNAGDARAVLCILGESPADDKVVPLSRDHSPESPRERKRIEGAGFSVNDDGRIDGMLNVARAIGDFEFKKHSGCAEEQAVTCAADVTVQPRPGGECFVVQACDGIWGAKSSEQVAHLVAERLRAGDSCSAAAEALCAACLAPTLSDDGVGTDNMSVNVLKITKG